MQPIDPYAHLDPKLRAAVMQADSLLKKAPAMQAKGTVSGSPIQGQGAMPLSSPNAAPGAPTTPALSPWQHFINWLGFGSKPAAKAQAMSLAKGAGYLADGGKSRAKDVNAAIDAAGGK